MPVISRGIPSGQLSLQFGQPEVAFRCTCLKTHSGSASCAAPTQLPSSVLGFAHSFRIDGALVEIVHLPEERRNLAWEMV